MNTRAKNILVAFVCVAALMAGCGSNVFESYDKKDTAQKAANDMEKGNPDKAITILEAELKNHPDDWKLVSLLSEAYAQKYGCDLLDLALAMANSSSSSSSSSSSKSSGISVMWPFLPEATTENINGIAYSVTLLVSIPPADRTNADNFKLAILSMASVSIHTKFFDTNNDGQLSAEELAAMGAKDAKAIVDGILAASSALSGADSIGANSDKAAEKINSIATKLSDSNGSTDQEKLADYFASEQK